MITIEGRNEFEDWKNLYIPLSTILSEFRRVNFIYGFILETYSEIIVQYYHTTELFTFFFDLVRRITGNDQFKEWLDSYVPPSSLLTESICECVPLNCFYAEFDE